MRTSTFETVSVYVVDDDPVDRRTIRRCLERTKGTRFLVTEFADSSIALSATSVCPPDVLLIDYGMSGMDGELFLRALRSKGLQVPAVLCSGAPSERGLRIALTAGFADFLQKRHLSTESLNRCISNALEKSRLKASLHAYQLQLEAAVHDLRSKNEEILSFYHTLSHELKTPLTSISEFISIVSEGIVGPVTADQRELLSAALRSTGQLTSLVNDLIDTSRMETGKLSVSREPCDLGELLDAAARTLRSRMEEKDLHFEVCAGEVPTPIDADVGRITQVISNLLNNALKFTPEGGTVYAAARRGEDGSCELLVEDSGPGIAEADQERIFERLYQTSSSEALVDGSGLGLFIARQILDLHGGGIWVESELGSGTTFHVTLPLRAAADPVHVPDLESS